MGESCMGYSCTARLYGLKSQFHYMLAVSEQIPVGNRNWVNAKN